MSDGKELKARAAARIGTVLHGKYRVDAVLGIGGMGAVFATTHRNQKRFAVKILHPEHALRDEFRRRFVREGYVANSLQHPGAVAILDDDVAEDGAPFLVMELLEGAALERVWGGMGRKLSPEAVIAMAHQVLDTLAAAHTKTVVHRDIKPANLFLQEDGAVKVLDFGIARVTDGVAANVTNTGALLGTPAFMAPEQAAGETNRIGGAADVWAVGATMFTLLSGKFVRTGESGQQVVIEAATKPARSLASVRADLPEDLVALVDRALAFEQEERPSAAEMRDALGALNETLFGAPVTRAPLVALLGEYELHAKPPSGATAANTEERTRPADDLVSGSAPTELPPLISPLAESAVGGTTAQSVSKAAPVAPGRPPAPPPRSRAAMFAVGAVAATLGIAFAVVRPLRTQSVPAPLPSTLPELAALPSAPLPPPSAASPQSPAPELLTGKLAVSPATATVEVDGTSVRVEGGMISLSGAPGSAHIVHVTSGKSDGIYPVLLTASGVVPRRVGLSPSPAGASGAAHELVRTKPDASAHPAPSGSALPVDPPAARTME